MKTEEFLKFFKKTERLKHTLRHAWTGDKNRQESTAEHTWHMSIMAMIFAPHLKNKVDLMKVLKMITIHDVGEALVGDTPAFSKNHGKKHKEEKEAVLKIAGLLPNISKKEIINLYNEYKAKKSKEALFVKMLDIIDVIFQHFVSDISTWCEEEFTFNLNRDSEKYFKDEPLLLTLYDKIVRELEEKVKKHKPSF